MLGIQTTRVTSTESSCSTVASRQATVREAPETRKLPDNDEQRSISGLRRAAARQLADALVAWDLSYFVEGSRCARKSKRGGAPGSHARRAPRLAIAARKPSDARCELGKTQHEAIVCR